MASPSPFGNARIVMFQQILPDGRLRMVVERVWKPDAPFTLDSIDKLLRQKIRQSTANITFRLAFIGTGAAGGKPPLRLTDDVHVEAMNYRLSQTGPKDVSTITFDLVPTAAILASTVTSHYGAPRRSITITTDKDADADDQADDSDSSSVVPSSVISTKLSPLPKSRFAPSSTVKPATAASLLAPNHRLPSSPIKASKNSSTILGQGTAPTKPKAATKTKRLVADLSDGEEDAATLAAVQAGKRKQLDSLADKDNSEPSHPPTPIPSSIEVPPPKPKKKKAPKPIVPPTVDAAKSTTPEQPTRPTIIAAAPIPAVAPPQQAASGSAKRKEPAVADAEEVDDPDTTFQQTPRPKPKRPRSSTTGTPAAEKMTHYVGDDGQPVKKGPGRPRKGIMYVTTHEAERIAAVGLQQAMFERHTKKFVNQSQKMTQRKSILLWTVILPNLRALSPGRDASLIEPGTLATLALVSKDVFRIVSPWLYAHITLRSFDHWQHVFGRDPAANMAPFAGRSLVKSVLFLPPPSVFTQVTKTSLTEPAFSAPFLDHLRVCIPAPSRSHPNLWAPLGTFLRALHALVHAQIAARPGMLHGRTEPFTEIVCRGRTSCKAARNKIGQKMETVWDDSLDQREVVVGPEGEAEEKLKEKWGWRAVSWREGDPVAKGLEADDDSESESESEEGSMSE